MPRIPKFKRMKHSEKSVYELKRAKEAGTVYYWSETKPTTYLNEAGARINYIWEWDIQNMKPYIVQHRCPVSGRWDDFGTYSSLEEAREKAVEQLREMAADLKMRMEEAKEKDEVEQREKITDDIIGDG